MNLSTMNLGTMNKSNSLFISGTDTDVGKTLIACALLHAANKRGLSTVAVKPIAAGCEPSAKGLRNSDALALKHYSGTKLDYELVNPIALEAAIAPHIAAKNEGVEFNNTMLVKACQKVLALGHDLTVIEGAGGWLVPLNDTETLEDLVVSLDIPVVLVVGVKLGCLNHALLSVQAIAQTGLHLAGWVANIVDDSVDAKVTSANIDTLRNRIHAPCLGTVPLLKDADAEEAAQYLDLSLLL